MSGLDSHGRLSVLLLLLLPARTASMVYSSRWRGQPTHGRCSAAAAAAAASAAAYLATDNQLKARDIA